MYEKEDAICFCNNFDEADRENVKFSAAFTKMPAVHRYGGEQRAEHASAIAMWVGKPEYPQTRAARKSNSFLEQDSTTVPKSAYLRFCPLWYYSRNILLEVAPYMISTSGHHIPVNVIIPKNRQIAAP